ncbi:MAG: hypothetical protein LBP79_04345 [Clostridiales bacterium]|jgi:hypothetical protein|nr:hypothetical protein [Clostridiales bacterium]
MEASRRNVLFDNFRGILVFVFVMLAVLGGIFRADVPEWIFSHALGRSLGPFGSPFTPVDLGMIFFYFVGGMTAVPAFKRRAASLGKNQALKRLFIRNIGLIGIGAVMYLVAGIVNKSPEPGAWGPLHSIGFTGLIVMFFLNLKPKWRALAGVALTAVHDIFPGFMYTYLCTPNFGADGGFAICVIYAGFFLITTVLFDLYEKGFGYFLLGLLPIFAYAAVVYGFGIIPPSYHPYNATFFAVTYCVVALLFILIKVVSEAVTRVLEKRILKRKVSGLIPLIGRMGRNLLFYFIARYPIALLFQILYSSLFVRMGAVAGGIAVTALSIALLYGVEIFFKKKNIIIKL